MKTSHSCLSFQRTPSIQRIIEDSAAKPSPQKKPVTSLPIPGRNIRMTTHDLPLTPTSDCFPPAYATKDLNDGKKKLAEVHPPPPHHDTESGKNVAK